MSSHSSTLGSSSSDLGSVALREHGQCAAGLCVARPEQPPILLGYPREAGRDPQRTYRLDAFLSCGSRIRGNMMCFTMDTSSWGLGVVASMGGNIRLLVLGRYVAEVLGNEVGSSKGHSTWEALVRLVSLRMWADLWVRADWVAALTLCMHLKTSGRGPGFIGSELALAIGHAEFWPQLRVELSGVATVTADIFPWRSQPGKPGFFPEQKHAEDP